MFISNAICAWDPNGLMQAVERRISFFSAVSAMNVSINGFAIMDIRARPPRTAARTGMSLDSLAAWLTAKHKRRRCRRGS